LEGAFSFDASEEEARIHDPGHEIQLINQMNDQGVSGAFAPTEIKMRLDTLARLKVRTAP
jgi:hypothetical protein